MNKDLNHLPANLPAWFCVDKDNGMSDAELQDKIRLEIFREVTNHGYDMRLWTEDFIEEVAFMYFRNFERSYNEFCMKELNHYLATNRLMNAFEAGITSGRSYLDNFPQQSLQLPMLQPYPPHKPGC